MTGVVEARLKAERLIELIGETCLQVQIAGSIRRRKRIVKDIEIVALAKTKPIQNLFGEVVTEISLLENRIINLMASREDFSFDPDLKRNGKKYKRLVFQGVKVDLFIAGHAREWGAVLAIRTGPWDFSKLLVTKQCEGGAMPPECCQKDNRIWTPGGPIDTSNEMKYFKVLGLPFWLPWERTKSKLELFLRTRARSGKNAALRMTS